MVGYLEKLVNGVDSALLVFFLFEKTGREKLDELFQKDAEIRASNYREK